MTKVRLTPSTFQEAEVLTYGLQVPQLRPADLSYHIGQDYTKCSYCILTKRKCQAIPVTMTSSHPTTHSQLSELTMARFPPLLARRGLSSFLPENISRREVAAGQECDQMTFVYLAHS
ncbi:hypothetical protein E2C01_039222 [Portunus trituberculatus]|uniref:Uncharacterized protein n=1 Tax=Portunus trituberculatus TaxID=210409 RepID=A0A5B7FD32_PORTR|nr:hypothetical protein [Portunus trituberculatus]